MAARAELAPGFASAAELEALGTDPIPTYPYYCPDYHAAEIEAIFRRAWLKIGHVCELPERGSFIVRQLEVAKASILISRGPDDVIRAFYNVCTHRGSKLVIEEEGRGTAFSCKYHMWNFGYDGRLRGAPDFDNFHIDKARCGLVSLPLEVCAGIMFVNLAPEPTQGLAEYLGPIAERLETFPIARAKAYTEYTYEVEANWKLIMDNFQENYHLRFVHARTGGVPPKDNPFGYPSGFTFFGPHAAQTMRGGGSLDPGPVQRAALGNILEFATADGLLGGPYASDYCVMFPNLFVFGSGMSPFALTVMPIGPTRSRGTFRFYWTSDDEDAVRCFTREFHAMMLRDLHAEDLPSIENSQAGLSSRALTHIHFQSQEALCRHLFNEVDRRVEAYRASASAEAST